MAEHLTFSEKLSHATNEDKQINPIYVEAISSNLSKMQAGMDKYSPSYDMYTDGVFNCYYLKDDGQKEWFLLQLECKRDIDLDDIDQRSKVLLQVFYYLKQFSREGLQLPKVIVLGTKVNCLALPLVNIYDTYIKLTNYAVEENGHIISASRAPDHPLYQPLLNQIKRDAELHSSIRVIEAADKNAIKELCIDILKVAKDLGLKEDITIDNLLRAYDFFEMKVVDSKAKNKLTSREIVGAFMQLMLNPDKVTAEQVKNALGQVTYSGAMDFNGKVIPVNPSSFNSFATVFAIKSYEIKDQKQFTALQDRLIEDTDRRRKGDFYTPTIWVDEAHKLMEKHLGPDWREKYMVWDCAWGTGNLTRDYAFSDLYCSTLIQEDLDTASRYNPFACKFQYDFLNDDVDSFERIPHIFFKPLSRKFKYSDVERYMNFRDILNLYEWAIGKEVTTQDEAQQAYLEALATLKSTKLYKSASGLINGLVGLDGKEQKGLVFLINPPYGTSGEFTSANGKEKKSGIASTAINDLMRGEKVGGCSQQLYAQFIYRISKLDTLFKSNSILGVFSPTLLMTGAQFKGLKTYCGEYICGYMIQASEFADVKGNWGISFTLWKVNHKNNSTEYNLEVRGVNELNRVQSIIKKLYIPSHKACDWAKGDGHKGSQIDTFTMSNAITVTNGSCKISDKSLGVALMNQNIVESNLQFVMILPRKLKGHLSSYDITEETFDKVISLFTARKLITPTWINCKDEYMVPDISHPKYAQWQNDCIVYSLFNTASNQSSLRSIGYNGKSWDVHNEFFWVSRDKMLKLAEDNNNMAVYDDIMAHGTSERFVYEKMKGLTISDDAQKVLDLATEILVKTFPYRQEFAAKHPEYHINTWDAGWYQIKAVAKEYLPDLLKAFNNEYKAFGDRMRPLVYELGFLYK